MNCKQTIQDAKNCFEKHITKNIKSNHLRKKDIRSRTPARQAVGPLEDRKVKDVLTGRKGNCEEAE